MEGLIFNNVPLVHIPSALASLLNPNVQYVPLGHTAQEALISVLVLLGPGQQQLGQWTPIHALHVLQGTIVVGVPLLLSAPLVHILFPLDSLHNHNVIHVSLVTIV